LQAFKGGYRAQCTGTKQEGSAFHRMRFVSFV
jgi:hypothetical protein